MLRFAQEYARGGEALPEKLTSEEGLAMVFDKMQRAQSDEETRIWAESREKYKRDEATRMHAAREEGLQEGREQGLQRGREQGLQQGRQQEWLESRRTIARSLLDAGLDVSMVALHTQLSEADVVALRDASRGGEQTPQT